MKTLCLPVNNYWYSLLKADKLLCDYRPKSDFWIKRLRGQIYDNVKFDHRFNKNLTPLEFNKCDIKEVEDMFLIYFK